MATLTGSRSPVTRCVLVLLLATAAAAWRFDPWTQQWVNEQPQQQRQPAVNERQGHAYQGQGYPQQNYQQQNYQQQNYQQSYRAQRRQDAKMEMKKETKMEMKPEMKMKEEMKKEEKKEAKTAECKNKNRAGRCLTKAERELLLPHGFALGFEPKVSFSLYNDPDMGQLKVQMKTDIQYTPPAVLVDTAGRSMGANARVMMDKRILYNTFKSMASKFGADGDACLQRAVCEVAEAPLRRDGMIGEILNLVLSPSHRLDESYSADVAELLVAEKRGREVGECHLAYPLCPLSLFNVIDSASDYTGSILDALADHDQTIISS